MSKTYKSSSVRIYYISKTPIEDIKALNDAFNNTEFVDKIFSSKVPSNISKTENIFINIKLLIELAEEDFNKIAVKINKILNINHKIFYKDTKNKYTFISPTEIETRQKSLSMFLQDD